MFSDKRSYPLLYINQNDTLGTKVPSISKHGEIRQITGRVINE
jgi:hypothetical protein